MNKFHFILLILCSSFLTQSNHLLSDQPNGKPWSRSFLYEDDHEYLEDSYEKLSEAPGCNSECEETFNEFHETLYEREHEDEETKVIVEFFMEFIY